MRKKLPIVFCWISIIVPIYLLLFGLLVGKPGIPVIPEKWFLFERICIYFISAYLIGVGFYLKKISFFKNGKPSQKKGLDSIGIFLTNCHPYGNGNFFVCLDFIHDRKHFF